MTYRPFTSKRHPLIKLQTRGAPEPSSKLISFAAIVPRNEEISQLALAVVIHRPVHLDIVSFPLEHILGRAPAEPTLGPPAEDGVHVALHPADAAGIRGVPRPPGHATLANLLAPSIIQHLEGGIAGDLCAHGGGAHAGVEAVGLLGDGDAGGGEDALQFCLVGGRLSDGVDVDLLDVDAHGVDGADEIDGGIHGLGVEV
ncbi:unnamed protein product, partial [Clonostachys rosea]